MKWPDAAVPPAKLANRLLAEQTWAREKLATVAGRAFSLRVGPLTASWSIGADGTLASAPSGVAPDLKLELSPLAVPSFLADPTRWNQYMQEEGDPALGGVLKELARTMPWFVEEIFAKALGPVAGQRAADAGRRLLAFPGYAAQRFAESVGSYARDEAGLLAHGRDFRLLAQGIDEVTTRVDALAERIEALDPRIRPIR
jgi:ubiquinone biosynthesis protein UbiJ